jgi:hypothetical protein
VDPFIKECRREWKRLRVPDEVANEMAADLAADLQEAESEGASREEVLGNGVFDPRSFAAAWAAERGVINQLPGRERDPGRSVMLAVIVACTVIAAIGAGLVIGSHLGSPAGRLFAVPDNRPFTRCEVRPGPVPPPPACSKISFALPGPARFSESVPRRAASPVGWTLLIVGIVGIALSMVTWWVVPGLWSRRRTHLDETRATT